MHMTVQQTSPNSSRMVATSDTAARHCDGSNSSSNSSVDYGQDAFIQVPVNAVLVNVVVVVVLESTIRQRANKKLARASLRLHVTIMAFVACTRGRFMRLFRLMNDAMLAPKTTSARRAALTCECNMLQRR